MFTIAAFIVFVAYVVTGAKIPLWTFNDIVVGSSLMDDKTKVMPAEQE
jgi:hypothetical protein